jgi:hypothetical protein
MAQLDKKEIFYTIPFYAISLDDNQYAITKQNQYTYAKIVVMDDLKLYYILLSDKNNVYNPYSIYNQNHDKFLFKEQDRCFKKVSKQIFDMYVKFLNSQNLALLYNVQRKVLI